MKSLHKLTLVLTSMLLVWGCSSPKKQVTEQKEEPKPTTFHPSEGYVESIEAELSGIIDTNAKIEVLSEGYAWSEGPVYVPGGDYLLFSDIPNNAIVKWKQGEGAKTYITPAGHSGTVDRTGEAGSNGLMLNADGQLVLCQHTDRRIAILNSDINEPKPQYITVTGEYEGKRFNSPNDLDIKSNGDIYFTDPPYGLEKGMNDPAKELDFQGVYKWSASDNSTTLLYKDLTRPNGIAFSPDEKEVYVANSDPKIATWTVFDVNDEGGLDNPRLLHDSTPFVEGAPGLPDGMDVDANGNIFATGPGGIWVFSAEKKLIGKILTGQKTANCTVAPDGYLYMTAHSFFTRIKLK
ncbi:MAG: SMP-30/gluconolactonase/LRE family protein [Cyclobacteriaceae bacterium]